MIHLQFINSSLLLQINFLIDHVIGSSLGHKKLGLVLNVANSVAEYDCIFLLDYQYY